MDRLITVLMCLCPAIFMAIPISAKHVQDQSIKVNDEQYVRVMIQTLMEQNRRLTLKNQQLHKVWRDMQGICESVNMLSCDCGAKQQHTSSNLAVPFFYTNSIKRSSESRRSDLTLQIRTVKSYKESANNTIMFVSYMSTLNHTTEWVGLTQNGGVWRTAGHRSNSEGNLFTSIVEIEEQKSLRDLIFFLYNEEASVNVRFNLTEMAKDQDQIVMKPTERIIIVDKRVQAMNSTDLNISTIVQENVSILKDFSSFEIYFTGVNYSSSEIFEVFSFNSDLITEKLSPRTNHTANMIIIVKERIAKFGGILTVRFWSPMSGLLQDLYHGTIIRIHATGCEDIVRENTLGVFPLPKQTIIFPPTTSLVCAAIGNPRPNVTILKATNGIERKDIDTKTETVVRDKNMIMKVLSFISDPSEDLEGRYICRASIGNSTRDSETEVIVFDEIVFNDTHTGVLQNESNVVTLSCMATGKPKPEISLRLYSDYGPSLVNAGEYKVWKENIFTSRVTLKILVEDIHDLHTVYCVASQIGGNHKAAKIELFQGVQKTYNWELYERIENMNVFL